MIIVLIILGLNSCNKYPDTKEVLISRGYIYEVGIPDAGIGYYYIYVKDLNHIKRTNCTKLVHGITLDSTFKVPNIVCGSYVILNLKDNLLD